MTFGLILALTSIGVLIYFIHHVTNSIRASTIVAAVARDLERAIERLFPSEIGFATGHPPDVPVTTPEKRDRPSRRIPAEKSGYLQAIDDDCLIRSAMRHDLILRLPYRPGHFVPAGCTLVQAWPAERLTDDTIKDIFEAFAMGDERTLIQDVEFAVSQLVEVAVRALSPGTNDPSTATACIDRLGSALSLLARREFPSPYRHDETGKLRLITDPVTFSGIVSAAFNEIRQYGRTSAPATIRLLETIGMIAEQVRTNEARTALLRQATMIERGNREGLPEEWDRQTVQERFKNAVEKLSGAD